MYGLILDVFGQWIRQDHGEAAWQRVLRAAGLETSPSFAAHQVYDEDLLGRVAELAAEQLKMETSEVYFAAGVFFVSFIGQYGYNEVLEVLGRDLTDFLNGLDGLHEYLRFSYPRLQPPSFYCLNESESGLNLLYRSRRCGFEQYVRGQIGEVARLFYGIEMSVRIETTAQVVDGIWTTNYRLEFDNRAFRDRRAQAGRQAGDLTRVSSVSSDIFLEIFPFNIVLDRQLKVVTVGAAMRSALPDLTKLNFADCFEIQKPFIQASWDQILHHLNNEFQLRCLIKLNYSSVSDVNSEKENSVIDAGAPGGSDSDKPIASAQQQPQAQLNSLHLKGQMKFMRDWDCMVFLGVPILMDIRGLRKLGFYITDLSLHDSSRDLVMMGEQKSAELKLMLDQELLKTQQLEESLKQLNQEKRKTDQLLYQMMPRVIADKLRQGDNVMSTCQTYDDVTIVFSDVIGFTTICSFISPLAVVAMLNDMYSAFDRVTERFLVYKVETTGDAYMLASGVPWKTPNHCRHAVETALEMLRVISLVHDPRGGNSLRIRIGVHRGPVVAGVVGLKMPRFCLFGDSVNLAQRVLAASSSGKILITYRVAEGLDATYYSMEPAESIEFKSKSGAVGCYYLQGLQPGLSKSQVDGVTQALRQEKCEATAEETRATAVDEGSSETPSAAAESTKSLASQKLQAADSSKAAPRKPVEGRAQSGVKVENVNGQSKLSPSKEESGSSVAPSAQSSRTCELL